MILKLIHIKLALVQLSQHPSICRGFILLLRYFALSSDTISYFGAQITTMEDIATYILFGSFGW